MSDEANWRGRDKYAIMSMAQTRAGSKALRQILSWVVALAGYNATPLEEVPTEENKTSPRPSVTPQKSSWQTAKENPDYYKEPPIKNGLISSGQAKYIRDLLKQKHYTEAELCAKYKVGRVEQLTIKQGTAIINNLMKLQPKVATKSVAAQEEIINLDEVDEGIEKMKEEAA